MAIEYLNVKSSRWIYENGIPKKYCSDCNSYKLQSEFYQCGLCKCKECSKKIKKIGKIVRNNLKSELKLKYEKNKRIRETVEALKNQRINNPKANN